MITVIDSLGTALCYFMMLYGVISFCDDMRDIADKRRRRKQKAPIR